ncbi:MAG: uridine diphosphate-N-acetylglucosamine-binding protein YvcK [Candidatus Brocadiaceae bacterium]|nr:uridine diphosphate-N-acetylglucosamine-binding protein YvcK [Candidatus Brocadiaceae bacterium]
MGGPLRAVVFDLDDTLYDCTGTLVEAARRKAAAVLVEAGLPMSETEAVALQRKLALMHGPHFLVFDEIARQYGLEPDAVDRAYRAYNSDEVDPIQPFPGVMETLAKLRACDIRRFLVTSGTHRRQSAKVRQLGLEDAFDEIVINDVDRGALLSESLRYLLRRHRLRPDEVLLVGDRPQEEIRVANDLGMTTAQVLQGRFSNFAPRDEHERPNYRVTGVFQVPTLLRLANMNKPPHVLRIVAIGGGTGLPIVLEGCKTYCAHPVGIVTVTDSGRSSGQLRTELGMLPPGDARNCLVALSEPGERERLLNRLFQYRFRQGSFNGMSLGNLLIAAMSDLEGSFEQGIRELSRLLNIRGRVLTPTLEDCQLCAELTDGTVVQGEANVHSPHHAPVRRVLLKPPAPAACQEAIEEIQEADIVVLGPGSLLTSVVANLLVPGVRDALARTKATRIYVGNIVTQPGQTDGLNARAHLQTFLGYVDAGSVDVALFNDHCPDQEVLARYRAEGAEMVLADDDLHTLGVPVVTDNLVEDLDGRRVLWEKKDLLRHHPDRLANAICRIYCDRMHA